MPHAVLLAISLNTWVENRLTRVDWKQDHAIVRTYRDLAIRSRLNRINDPRSARRRHVRTHFVQR
jgi:hypothetical protein